MSGDRDPGPRKKSYFVRGVHRVLGFRVPRFARIIQGHYVGVHAGSHHITG